MKAWLFGLAWVGLGAVFMYRAHNRPSAERAMMLLFWPFFITGPAAPTTPLARLAALLDPGDPLIAELQAALDAIHQRKRRLAAALVSVRANDDDPLAQAQRRSQELLERAYEQAHEHHQQTLASIEETSTRLMLAREAGDDQQIRALLGALRARVRSVEEVNDIERTAARPAAEQR